MPESHARAACLEVSGLCIRAGGRTLVDGVSFSIRSGQILAMCGPSGSGKTLTAMACLGLVRPRPGVVAGTVRITCEGVAHEPYASNNPKTIEQAFTAIRGTILGHLPQNAHNALNPLWTVGKHLAEVLQLRDGALRTDLRQVHHWLRVAGFDHPAQVIGRYPHELSGGMAQRACISLALARGSRFLIADEPVTGLDPTVAQGIIEQIRQLKQHGIGVLFITHDLRIVPQLADEVLVMDGGRIEDHVAAQDLHESSSPTTQRLLEATARISGGLF
jgi:ABC-type glutathione transport system ATPase component